MASSVINVNVDSEVKKEATAILNDLGLNMSTAINMFLTQVIKTDGIPFRIRNPKPSKELLEAIDEGEKILKEMEEGKRKGYSNMDDLIKSLDRE